MAFFLNREGEYFSLNLNPKCNDEPYIYRLNKNQTRISEIFIPFLSIFSFFNLVIVLIFAVLEHFGFIQRVMTIDAQELTVLILGFLSMISAFSEVVFFMWIRIAKINRRTDARFDISDELVLEKNKSCKAYCCFLGNMLLPFIGLAALPGGLPVAISAASQSSSGFLFLIVQLGLALGAFSIVIFRHIVKILT